MARSKKDRSAVISSVATRRISKQLTRRRRVDGRYAAEDPPPSLTPYQYTPLKEDFNEIRLLTLHEGRFIADIQVSIHTVPLTPENPPIYEALSYFWGSPETPVEIQVGLATLAVTWNLAEALPYLRYRDKPRTFWIDAICVNQQDLKERGHQVKRMADIYRLANRVVVWLGPEKNKSGRGMKMLDQLGSQIKVDFTTKEMKPASKEVEPHWSDDRQILPYGTRELLAVNELLSRPWFERLWVQQEIRLAKSNAILLCGLGTISWQSFCRAIICLYTKPLSPKPLSPNLSGLRDRLRLIEPFTEDRKTFILREIMSLTLNCKCFDPRDRIYAVLSLLTDDEKALDIEVDYTKTTSQVYLDVALRYIARHKDLNVLITSTVKDEPLDIPAWVPNWTVANPFVWGLASGYSVSEFSNRGAGVLSVTGTHVATVQHAERIEACNYLEDTILEIQRLAPHDILRRPYVGGGNLFDAFCHTLCADDFSDNELPPRKDFPQFEESKKFLSAILRPEKKLIPDCNPGTEAAKFLNAVRYVFKQRSFIETREGYMGLAPQMAEPGDQVCVLLGSRMPLLLRPAPNLQYQVIGACFVHGLMQGKAFLGPIPDHFQVVGILEKRRGERYDGFLDHRNGKTQYRDPRFEASLEDDGEEHVWVWTHPDGSQSRRLTANMLAKRGVKLQTFDLI